ncbi:MAG: F0F1 ATP synthase subunit delta, partial [Rhodococcus qingshengii]
MSNMYAASREALAQTRSALSSALGAVSAGAATAASAQAGSELFSVVEV